MIPRWHLYFSKRITLLACFLAAVGWGSSAGLAAILTFQATLTGGQEVPPNSSPAVGSVTAIYDQSTGQFSVGGTFGGLTAPATAAHVPRAAVGVAGPVVNPLSLVPGGSPSGAFVIGAFASPLTPAQITQLQNGEWYVNVHNANFPGGEIRGQLLVQATAGKGWRRNGPLAEINMVWISIPDINPGYRSVMTARWGLGRPVRRRSWR